MAVSTERPPQPTLDLTFLENAALRLRRLSPSIALASMMPTPVPNKPPAALPARPFLSPTQWAPADLPSYHGGGGGSLALPVQTEVTVVDLAPFHCDAPRDFSIVELPSTPLTADLWMAPADRKPRRSTPTAASAVDSAQKSRGGKVSKAWAWLKSALASLVVLLIVVGTIVLALRLSRMASS